jgi:uncharacterized protein (TIGR03067 family)
MRSVGLVGMIPVIAVFLVGGGQTEVIADEKEKPKFDGKWYVARQEEFGNVVPAVVSKRLTMVIDGKQMEWYIGNPAPNFTATITIDEEKKTIDAKVTRGSLNGKTMLGIYKFEKDQLHMCWAELGAARPEKFASTKPGGGAYNYTIYSREPVADAPPVVVKKTLPDVKVPAVGKRPKLADLKFTLAKKWEAEFQNATNSWNIVCDGFTPSIRAQWALPRDYPKNLDDYIDRLQKSGDHFAYGVFWSEVTDKGKLGDGFYVVGKVKLKPDKEAKGIGFSIIRDFDSEKLIFESFSKYYEEDKLLKEALEICKSAKFDR